MVVMVLENVPPGLRGELSLWMIEVRTGVYVGTLSALVRDLLWDKCLRAADGGRCCQVYTANNEQGFALRIAGDSRRSVVDLNGLQLVADRISRWQQEARRESQSGH